MARFETVIVGSGKCILVLLRRRSGLLLALKLGDARLETLGIIGFGFLGRPADRQAQGRDIDPRRHHVVIPGVGIGGCRVVVGRDTRHDELIELLGFPGADPGRAARLLAERTGDLDLGRGVDIRLQPLQDRLLVGRRGKPMSDQGVAAA
ncbi:MAG: hypothetical protein KBC46_03230 [Ferrovibrio sp.]|nr:hypothetical protein [Ferrovibrio sp.]